MNQDNNTVFDQFDNFYGKWAGPKSHPDQFMKYLDDTYNNKYLNLKPTRYLKPQHMEAFLKLKTKELDSYNNNMTISKVIDVKEPTINLKSKENREQYIQYLEKIKEKYEFLEAFQLGSKDMDNDFNF